jgi:hypothetical protein
MWNVKTKVSFLLNINIPAWNYKRRPCWENGAHLEEDVNVAINFKRREHISIKLIYLRAWQQPDKNGHRHQDKLKL